MIVCLFVSCVMNVSEAIINHILAIQAIYNLTHGCILYLYFTVRIYATSAIVYSYMEEVGCIYLSEQESDPLWVKMMFENVLENISENGSIRPIMGPFLTHYGSDFPIFGTHFRSF